MKLFKVARYSLVNRGAVVLSWKEGWLLVVCGFIGEVHSRTMRLKEECQWSLRVILKKKQTKKQ